MQCHKLCRYIFVSAVSERQGVSKVYEVAKNAFEIWNFEPIISVLEISSTPLLLVFVSLQIVSL